MSFIGESQPTITSPHQAIIQDTVLPEPARVYLFLTFGILPVINIFYMKISSNKPYFPVVLWRLDHIVHS